MTKKGLIKKRKNKVGPRGASIDREREREGEGETLLSG